MDYEAHIGSVDAIRQQLPDMPGNWPSEDFSLQEQLARIGYVGRNWMYRGSFTYAVLSTTEIPYGLGGVHIQPSRKLGYEAEVYFWVRTAALGRRFGTRTLRLHPPVVS